MINTLFVTGTDTSCGKTYVTSELVIQLTKLGIKAAGMKPIATGDFEDGNPTETSDIALIRNSSSLDLSIDHVNQFRFPMPCSPNIAAELCEIDITVEDVVLATKKLQKLSDVLIIEGVGGWHVPLSSRLLLSDLVKILNCPVVLVVGVKLGCINHALLTTKVIQQEGHNLIGWIANLTDPGLIHHDKVIKTIEGFLDIPMLAKFEYNKGIELKNTRLYEKFFI